ncbi:DapH/DapD/GlmU-related protein [Streptomyces sp. NPDC001792]|uniref:DapH/DapD/GlmU-related protein n=1 Tax=Streptomyces sp. NPDC001792 TaxID=3154524 RepID=UPI003317DACC
MGLHVQAVGAPLIDVVPGSHVTLGDRVVLVSRTPWTALGVARPVILRTLRQGAIIHIGPDTGLSGVTVCAATGVDIGARVLVGADVLITDTDFHPVDVCPRRTAPESAAVSRSVHIGDDVFLGARSIVLKGVSIGDGTVVGAGSVVSSSLPGHVVAAGNPCRVLRPLRLPVTADGSGR